MAREISQGFCFGLVDSSLKHDFTLSHTSKALDPCSDRLSLAGTNNWTQQLRMGACLVSVWSAEITAHLSVWLLVAFKAPDKPSSHPTSRRLAAFHSLCTTAAMSGDVLG